MASAETKAKEDSEIVEEIKPQMIRPAERNGKKSFIGVENRLPKINPKHAIITPVEIVIQKGPSVDRL